MPGVFRRGGAGEGRPNPMGAKLAGVVPPVPAPDEVDEPAPGAPAPDALASGSPAVEAPAAQAPPAQAPVAQAQAVAAPAAPAVTAPAGMKATAIGANTTSLAAAAVSGGSLPTLLSVQAGFNLPTPDPFARNRQRVGRSFGEAVVGDGALVLRLRRKRVGLFVPPVRIRPDEVALAAPTESDFMGNNRGVALVRPDGEHLYVWVDDPAALLGVLAAHGFTTGDDPVPVTRAG